MTDSPGSYCPITLFYSYSHKDESLRKQLETHLALLRRQGVIAEWHDRKIGAGAEWAGQIDENLNSANIVLLLVSADFLASDYCYDIELRQALERHEAGQARVIPVILRDCDWTGASFGKLQSLPTDARPVTSWDDRDEAFTIVAKGIRQAIEETTGGRTAAELSPGAPPFPISRFRVTAKGLLSYDKSDADFFLSLLPPPLDRTQQVPAAERALSATDRPHRARGVSKQGRVRSAHQNMQYAVRRAHPTYCPEFDDVGLNRQSEQLKFARTKPSTSTCLSREGVSFRHRGKRPNGDKLIHRPDKPDGVSAILA